MQDVLKDAEVSRTCRKMICYPTDVKMIRNRFSGVMAYFIHRITNPIAEGMNSKIATIQKMAYGFRNNEHFKTAPIFPLR